MGSSSLLLILLGENLKDASPFNCFSACSEYLEFFSRASVLLGQVLVAYQLLCIVSVTLARYLYIISNMLEEEALFFLCPNNIWNTVKLRLICRRAGIHSF